MENKICEKTLISLRRTLHECAEVAFSLPHTRKIIIDHLVREGVEYKEIGKGSVVARLGRGERGILLRADMDALPMEEKSDLPFSSKNGCMHACGHDMHTAMLLGAISLLNVQKEKLTMEIRFLFQASEENLLGAVDAIACGILDGWEEIKEKNDEKCKQRLEKKKEYFISKAFSLHCVTAIPLSVGKIIVPNGGTGAQASRYFSLTYRGDSSHGGTPHIGKDALWAMHVLYQAFSALPQNTVSITDQPLLTIGEFYAGTAPNVIASSASLSGTVRSISDKAQEILCERMTEVSQKIAVAYGVSSDVSFLGYAPTLYNDPKLSVEVEGKLTAFLGKERVVSTRELEGGDGQKRNGGSEDFAHFSHLVPSLLIAICAGDSREGYCYPLHHPCVRFDERALFVGAKVYELLALS